MCVFSGKTPTNYKENDKNTVICNKESRKSVHNIKNSLCFRRCGYISRCDNSSCRTFYKTQKTINGKKHFYKSVDNKNEICENYFKYLLKNKIKRECPKKEGFEASNGICHTRLSQCPNDKCHETFVKNKNSHTSQNLRFHSSQANCENKNYLTENIQRDTIKIIRAEHHKKSFPVGKLKSHFQPLLVIFISILCMAAILKEATAAESKVYTNEWVIEVEGGEKEARDVARQHRLVFVDKARIYF